MLKIPEYIDGQFIKGFFIQIPCPKCNSKSYHYCENFHGKYIHTKRVMKVFSYYNYTPTWIDSNLEITDELKLIIKK